MAIIAHKILDLQILQARLAKDGTDDDIKFALSDDAIKKANVKDRTERVKSLLRLGIQAETGVVLTQNHRLLPHADDDFIFDGHDLAPADSVIVVKIGSNMRVYNTTTTSLSS